MLIARVYNGLSTSDRSFQADHRKVSIASSHISISLNEYPLSDNYEASCLSDDGVRLLNQSVSGMNFLPGGINTILMATNNLSKRNQYALITGGTSGIGYELAKLCAKDGYNLVLVARSSERLQEVSDEFRQLDVEVISLDKNLFDLSAAKDIYNEVRARGIQIDILINNAGQGQRGRFHEIALERHVDLLQLNIVSLVELTRMFLDDMISRGEGKILNLASVVSKTPAPEFSIYAASKAFVLSFSEALAKELEETNITVTALLPGRTDTDFFFKADMNDAKEYQEHMLADPEKVARDGYEALMSGKNRIISGMQNKMMVGMMNTMPDGANAANMQKNMQPSDKDPEDRRYRPSHEASEKEREAISNDQD